MNQQDNKPLTYIEKKQLCENIKKIEPKYLKGVLDIVKECTDMKGEDSSSISINSLRRYAGNLINIQETV